MSPFQYKLAETFLDGKPCYPEEEISFGESGLYALFEFSGKCRYFGITRDYRSRYYAHLYGAKNKKTHRDKWIFSLLERGEFPIMISLFSGPRGYILELEKKLISDFKVVEWPLVNGTDGGDGVLGVILGVEARRSISSKLRKPVNYQIADNNSVHVLANRGESNHQSKLTNEKVKEMRDMMNAGYTNIEVSRIFNISPSQVSRIRRYESWKF